MTRQNHSQTAFSLIEVTLALGIAAFCLLTVFGLLPLGLNSSQNASEQTAVSGIVTDIAADFHGTPALSSTSSYTTTARFHFQIPSPGNFNATKSFQTLYFSEDGEAIGSPGDDANPGLRPTPRYRATVTIHQDSTLASVDQYAKLYKIWVLVTWPALADNKAVTFPSNFAGSYEAAFSMDYFSNP